MPLQIETLGSLIFQLEQLGLDAQHLSLACANGPAVIENVGQCRPSRPHLEPDGVGQADLLYPLFYPLELLLDFFEGCLDCFQLFRFRPGQLGHFLAQFRQVAVDFGNRPERGIGLDRLQPGPVGLTLGVLLHQTVLRIPPSSGFFLQ